jgi:hypothetical protein
MVIVALLLIVVIQGRVIRYHITEKKELRNERDEATHRLRAFNRSPVNQNLLRAATRARSAIDVLRHLPGHGSLALQLDEAISEAAVEEVIAELHA